jgi:CRP-like cAMP-binding protein
MSTTTAPKQNQLLAALPSDVQERLFPHLELVSLRVGQVLYEAGQPRRHVYFPTNAIVSLLSMGECGSSTEISMVGNEGIVGMASFMGSECSPWRVVGQSAGQAYRLLGQRMKDEFDRHGSTLLLMLRYAQARTAQIAQTVACNRHHSIDQQLCRWLLLSLDRLPSNRLATTQEFISNMLGVRREGVTDAAGKLQKLGVIEYHRGNIAILDRHRLEKMSCECYAAVKKETDRLLPRACPRPVEIPSREMEWGRQLATA